MARSPSPAIPKGDGIPGSLVVAGDHHRPDARQATPLDGRVLQDKLGDSFNPGVGRRSTLFKLNRQITRSPVRGVCFRGDLIFATTSADSEDSDGCTVYTGQLLKISEQRSSVVHKSKEHGFTALVSLRNGDLALGTTDRTIAILSADGKVKRTLKSQLGCSIDWLAAGGEPERLLAATTASGGNESIGIEEWSTHDWQYASTPLASTRLPGLSATGASRVREDGRIAAYAWGGKPAPKSKAVVGRGHWRCVPFPDGWFLYNAFGSGVVFVDGGGQLRWAHNDLRLFTACAVGAQAVVGVGGETVMLIEIASGRAVASAKHQNDSISSAMSMATDGAGTFAIGSDGGVDLLKVTLRAGKYSRYGHRELIRRHRRTDFALLRS